ncbi:hypothetical protein HDU98_008488, partial [Podochytrium sp. JEL0797]
MVFGAALLLPFLSLASAGLTADKFSFSAAPSTTSASSTTVCINGPVPNNAYIGFGIPASSASPIMAGANLIVVFADSTNTVHVLNGLGTSTPSFGPTTNSTAVATLNYGTSYYALATLNVCVDVPAAWIPNAPASYLWSTGMVAGGAVPLQHSATGRGAVTGVNLFGAAA